MHLRLAVILGLLVAGAALSAFFSVRPTFGALSTWTQTDWSGGTDSGTGAVHPTDQTGWDGYTSVSGVSGTDSPGNVALATANFAATDDGVLTTTGSAAGGGFGNGTVAGTVASESGAAASVRLAIGSTTTANTFDTAMPPVPNTTSSAVVIRNGADDEIYALPAGTAGFQKYSFSANTWTSLAAAPVSLGGSRVVIRNGADDDIYVLQGSSTGFYRYSISTNTWTTLTVVPGTIAVGASMVRYGASDDIYVLRGNSTGFYRYSISGNSWTALTVVPATVASGGTMFRNGADNDIYVLSGGTGFYRYSISGNSWTTLTGVPAGVGTGRSLLRNGGDNEIYVLPGNGGTGFYRYSISGNSWTTLTAVPTAVASGGAMIRNGADNEIYVLSGGTGFYRYSISGNSWTTLAVTPVSASVSASLIRNGADNAIYMFPANGGGFNQYSISGNSWIGSSVSNVTAVPGAISAGASMIRNGADDDIYVLQGNSTANFYRHSISSNSWTTLAPLPATMFGGVMIRNGADDDIYVLLGSNSTSLYRYSISGNSWTTLTSVPATVGNGGTMIRNGADDDIYVLRGGSSTSFYRYSISGNSWTTLTVVPATVTTGASMIRNGADDDIYVLRGTSTGFYRYSISGNSWTTLTVAPAATGAAAKMIRDGASDDIYVLRGTNTSFYRYSILGNSWTTLTVVPGSVSTGGTMIRNGADDDIYVLRGGTATSLYRYSVLGNSWTTLEAVPGPVSTGASMIRNGADNEIYILQGNSSTNLWRYVINEVVYDASGTFTSAVIDTAGVTAFGNLSWSAGLPAGTTLTFATRTGATAVPDGSWSAWSAELSNSAGSAIVSPTARYVQYRGTFGTSDTAKTAALNSLSIGYVAYPTSGNIVSSSFNSANAGTSISGLSWVEDAVLPSGTSVTVSLRTASSAEGLSGSWEDFTNATAGCTKTTDTVTCVSGSIPATLTAGGDDQYLQYKVSLGTASTATTPTVSNVIVSYSSADASSGGNVHTGTIAVVKWVVNDSGGTKNAADFPLFVNGVPVVSGVSHDFPAPAGVYVVTETVDPGYVQSFSGDCDASGRLNLGPGDVRTCIITNDDIGSPVTPSTESPMIQVSKTPDVTSLPAGGGAVTYVSNVTNRGSVAIRNVRVSDDACAPTAYVSGDANNDTALDLSETWVYVCQKFITRTTVNTVVASGDANSQTTSAYALATVTVSGSSTSYSVSESLASASTISADKSLNAAQGAVACSPGSLLKMESDGNPATQIDSAVYYCGIDGRRFLFPNLGTYTSWYKDFSGVRVVSSEALAAIPLGDVVTYRPGSRMLKIETDARSYAIAKGGVLRWVMNEAVARALYGGGWNRLISDIPVTLFLGYVISEPIALTDVVPGMPGCTSSMAITAALGVGSTSVQVRSLQELLQCLGYFPGDRVPTNYFGAITEQALKAFQAESGIASSGTVDALTREALKAYARR
ncbi:MAG: peptidoglycan-binding protein [Patescibacteria group bacterium]|jgi:uncharacterized repeat protein (TIGR01451 family)